MNIKLLSLGFNGVCKLSLCGIEKEIDLTKVYTLEEIEKVILTKIREIANKNLHTSNLEDFIDNFIYCVKNGKVLICNERGVGVSSFLEELSRYFNLYIVTNRVNVYKSLTPRNIEGLRGINIKNNPYIVVDNVGYDVIDELRSMGFKVIGITNISNNIY